MPVLGTSLDVLTLNGHVKVTVPPARNRTACFGSEENGLPEFRSKRRGDLLLRMDVRMPEKLGADERKQWERLRAIAKKRKTRKRTVMSPMMHLK